MDDAKTFETKLVPLDDLKPAPYNPREISSDAFDGLKASLKEFGLVEPLILNPNTGFLVGGHQRLRAMKELRDEGAFPDEVFVTLVPLTEEREKMLNLALNNKHAQGRFTRSAAEILDEIASDDASKILSALRLDEVRLDFAGELDFEVTGTDFEPKPDMEPPRLDKKKPIECPECGHEFTTP